MIELADVPELRDPIMIAAFEGWNDAGEAATAVIEHLTEVWGAEPVAAIDPEEYYDFQVSRPRIVRDDGTRRISWPTTRILLATSPSLSRDVILVQGIEPSARWRSFTIELLEYAEQLGITTFVTLGALLADVPHTRPLPVSATSEHEDVAQRLGLEPGAYEGPTGIVGVLADAAGQSELAAVSCWAAVPHYAGGTPSPKATLALIAKLEELFNLTIPRGDLSDQAKAWEQTVDELAESDEEVADYIRSLEQAQDTVDLPEASGDAIAREFERYLRRRGDNPPAG